MQLDPLIWETVSPRTHKPKIVNESLSMFLLILFNLFIYLFYYWRWRGGAGGNSICLYYAGTELT